MPKIGQFLIDIVLTSLSRGVQFFQIKQKKG